MNIENIEYAENNSLKSDDNIIEIVDENNDDIAEMVSEGLYEIENIEHSLDNDDKNIITENIHNIDVPDIDDVDYIDESNYINENNNQDDIIELSGNELDLITKDENIEYK